jgi:predicted nucleic acid-binding protein
VNLQSHPDRLPARGSAGETHGQRVSRPFDFGPLIELLQRASPVQLKTARDFVNRLEIRVLPVTEIIGNRALTLIERNAPIDGLQLGDALIAATALERGDTQSTGNVRHSDVY